MQIWCRCRFGIPSHLSRGASPPIGGWLHFLKKTWLLSLLVFLTVTPSVVGSPQERPSPPATDAEENPPPDERAFRESIVVTAERREKAAQEVPLSLSVFDDERLRDIQAETIQDLTLATPNLNVFQTRSSASNAALFIRGIGQEDTVFTVDSGVGLYVDDVLLPRAQTSLLDLLDVERVEVLRGPQGTLYGRNTLAGALHYITRPPALETTAEVELTAGNFNRQDFRGVFNFPFFEKAAARIAIASLSTDGYELNSFSGDRLTTKDSFAGRATVAFEPRDDVKMTFRADALRERPSIRVGALLRPQQTALDYPGLVAGRVVTIPVSRDPFRVRSNVQDKQDVDTWGASGTIVLGWIPSLSLKSVTSYRELASDTRIDFDASEARGADVFAIQDHRQASQEIQLSHTPAGSRWNTVAGLFLFYEDDDQFDGTDASAKGFSIDSQYAQTTKSYAAYSQTRYKLSARWSVTGGLRYTWEEKEFSRRSEQHRSNLTAPDFNAFGGFSNGPGGRPPSRFPGNGIILTNIRDASANWAALTPEAGVQHSSHERFLQYFRVARGFKSGGFNGRANQAANPQQGSPYEPEYVWSYEAGAKNVFWDDRLVANAAVFYNDYKDLQLASFSGADLDGDGIFDTYLPLFTNAGKAVTQGVELEIRAYVSQGMEVSASAGYVDSEFKEFRERDRDLSDVRELPNAPKWTGSLGISHFIPITDDRNFQIGGTLNYQGMRFLTVSNLPDLRQDAYTLVNAFVALDLRGGDWRIVLGGRNLTDERYLVSGLDASSPPFGVVTGFYGDPRTWSLSLTTRF